MRWEEGRNYRLSSKATEGKLKYFTAFFLGALIGFIGSFLL
jgi:hypothetical protein